MPPGKAISNLQILNDLENSGALKSLVQAGIISVKVITHREIFFFVQSQISTGHKKTDAVTWAADKFGISNGQVWKVLRTFSKTFQFISE